MCNVKTVFRSDKPTENPTLQLDFSVFQLVLVLQPATLCNLLYIQAFFYTESRNKHPSLHRLCIYTG